MLKRLCLGRVPNNFGHSGTPPLGRGAGLTLRNMLLQPVLPCQIWSFYVAPWERNYEDSLDPSCPAFQAHSRTLQLTRIYRLPMTSYYAY